ncbi:hypothetical protein PAEPH01_1122 [Pancytospora epiphaga]|nr:hypothetical protein PAEPH01_1122 [Pancytospora epiphaga]
MLREAEYNKDGTAFVQKYRAKNKRNKKVIKKLRADNEKLKAKTAGVTDATCTTTFVTDSSDTVIKRVEELTETNRMLRKQIYEADKTKRDVEERMRRLESGFRRDSIGTQNQRRISNEFKIPEKSDLFEKKNGPLGGDREYRTDYITTNGFGDERLRKEMPFREMFSSPNGTTAIMPELRGQKEEYTKPNLYNNYDESGTGEIPGGFVDDTVVGQLVDNAKVIGGGFSKKSEQHVETQPSLFGVSVKPERPARGKTASVPLDKAVGIVPTTEKRIEPVLITEGHSNESIKTYHTTSTLKDMIARTERLQERFESLEDQLAHIKEGNTEERLVDKMRTYSTRCSELNIDSNDSDFI